MGSATGSPTGSPTGPGVRTGVAVPGVALVATAAALWGTDGVLRRGLALELGPATIVFYEHLLLVAATAWLLPRATRAARRMDRGDWVALAVIGVGASAVATMLFTAAFRYGDPTTPLLLQKLQPVIAIVAARLLLGERLRPRFAWFAAAALGGAWLISFADPFEVSVAQAGAAGLALGAAALWALGTVLGRRVSRGLTAAQLTALRFAIGLPAAAVVVAIDAGGPGFDVATGDLGRVALLAAIPGLLAMTVYYRGLRATPASAATLAELAFPLSAITLNYLVFGQTLTPSQWLGVVVLAGTLVVMSLQPEPRALGVDAPDVAAVPETVGV